MNSKKLDPFQFSNMLDNKFLDELFENDTDYACAVFEDFLTNISQYWKEVEQAATSKDPAALKAAVHKTKPLFGYVGHTAITNTFHWFEEQCSKATAMSDINTGYELIVTEKIAAVQLIESETRRLQQYIMQ